MPEIILPLCVRIDADDLFSLRNLQQDGWRQIEILEVWSRPADGTLDCTDHTIEMASRSALEACCWIASTSFKYDRLHRDREVDNALADQEKIKRVKQGFNRATESVYIAREERDVHGFVIISVEEPHVVIELIAVDRRHRHKGIAKALLGHIALKFQPMTIIAGTQDSNRPAQALYEACGFQHISSHRTFHKP